MAEPTLRGRVAGEIFRQLRDMTGDVVRNTHDLRDKARTLQTAAHETGATNLAELADSMASLANVIDSDAYELEDLLTLLALFDLDEVRTRLGIVKKAPNRPRRTVRKETETQEIPRAKNS